MKRTQAELNQVVWIILEAVKNLRVGKHKLAQFLKGSKSKDVNYISNETIYGGLMWHNIPTIIGFIEQLETIGLMHRKVISGSPYDCSIFEITEAGEKVLEEKIPIALQIIKEKKPITVGDSEKESLKLVHEGKTVSEIAKERNLAESTIYTHFFRLIVNQYLSSEDIITQENIKRISSVAGNFKSNPSVKEIKELLPDISYEEIRCVLADMKH